MDTVWLRLTVDNTLSVNNSGQTSRIIVNPPKNHECFMFGPTGIVKFVWNESIERTILFAPNRLPVATVVEDDAYIMKMLGTIRNTSRFLRTESSKRASNKKKQRRGKK